VSSEGGIPGSWTRCRTHVMKPEIMESVSTRRQRIVLAARKNRHEPLTALNHHMDLNWLAKAYRSVRANAAPGIDGWTVAQYGVNLVENLRDLQVRAKSGSYQAPAVKRAYVPKNEKEDRPIGIPTTEDKILQRAVAMILEPVYEQEFLPFSFGFRRGRSQHDALEYLREQCFEQKVQWVLEVDLAKFFDTVDHRRMRELLSRRVQDGVITRLVGKWLKAGIMEDGNVSYPDEGTPRLLRSHRELPHAVTAAAPGDEGVAQVALAAQPWQQPELGGIPGDAADVSVIAGPDRSLQNVGNHDPEEPGALIALVRICGGRRLTFGSSGPIPEPAVEAA